MTTKTTAPLRDILRDMKPGTTLYVRVAERIYESNPPMSAYVHYHAALNSSGGYMLELDTHATGSPGAKRWRIHDSGRKSPWYPATMLYNMVCGLCALPGTDGAP